MSSNLFPIRRWTIPLLLALAGLGRSLAADADPAAPESPTAPPVEATPVEPASPPPAPVSQPPRRWRDRDQVVGIFHDAHLRANEITEHVVTIFANAAIDGRVTDNAVSVFGSATANGEVEGNFVCVFGDGVVNQTVGGNVVNVFGKLRVGPGVVIEGNLVSIGSADLDESARINGEDVQIPIPGAAFFGTWIRESLLYGRLYPLGKASTWVFIGLALVFSLLLAVIFRGPIEANVSVLERRPGGAFINGILGVFLVPPVLLLLTATGVGALIVPFVAVGILFATALGVIALYRFCGARLGLGANPLLALVTGAVLFGVLFGLPAIGLFTWMGVTMLGFGTALTAWGEARRRDKRGNGPPAAVPPATGAPASIPVIPAPGATTPAAPLATPAASLAAPAEPLSGSSAFADTNPPASLPVAPPLPASATEGRPTASGPAIPSAVTPAPRTLSGLERAEFWPRLAATFLDFLVVGAATITLPLPVNFLPLWLIYHIAFWAWRATTLGGVVLNLRIERLDGRKVDLGVAVVRALGAIMSVIPFGLGFLWMNWDPEQQTWHDKIAGTVIVRAPKGHSLI